MSDDDTLTLRVLAGQLAAAAGVPWPEGTPSSPPPEQPPSSGGGRAPIDPEERQPGDIYPGCPVTALGVHGARFYYLDILRQLQDVDNHTKDRMRGLFGGRSDMLMAQFPRWSKGSETNPPKVIGWDQEQAAASMMRACSERGVWSPVERVRGLGAWPDEEGGIVLHCGDAILAGDDKAEPGEIEGYVYPGDTPAPRPTRGDVSAAGKLLERLGTWNWQRADLDAALAVGWMAGAMVGGALRWRPAIWVTGDRGSGKSTLLDLLEYTLGGRGAVLKSSDPTAAGVWQFLMQSTIPVILDEAEAGVDNRALLNVVKFARQAASGGLILRGGADHKGHQFRARSCFAFSSILRPPLLDQDLSRIALLKLNPLDEAAPKLDLVEKDCRRLGQAVRGSVIEQWARWGDTLDAYRAALMREGHDARSADQYGTLLAMLDMVLETSVPGEARASSWAVKLAIEAVRDQTDELSDWQRCLNHLFGLHLDMYRSGERHSVGSWVLAAAALRDYPDQLKAADALPQWGMRVVGRGAEAKLRVANRHPMLDQLFQGTHWQGGVWSQALERVPFAQRMAPSKFAGVVQRSWEVPLTSIPGLFGDDAAPAPAAQAPLQPAVNPEDFA